MLEIRTPTGHVNVRVTDVTFPRGSETWILAGGWTVSITTEDYSSANVRCYGCDDQYKPTVPNINLHSNHGGDSMFSRERLLEELSSLQHERDTWAQKAAFASSALRQWQSDALSPRSLREWTQEEEEAAYIRGSNDTRERIRQILGLDST